MLEEILKKLDFDSFYEKHGPKIGKYILISSPITIPSLTLGIIYVGEQFYNLLK